jgi:hypothetical protein
MQECKGFHVLEIGCTPGSAPLRGFFKDAFEQVVALTRTSQLVETVNGRLYRLRDRYCLDSNKRYVAKPRHYQSLPSSQLQGAEWPRSCAPLQKTDEFCCLKGTHL